MAGAFSLTICVSAVSNYYFYYVDMLVGNKTYNIPERSGKYGGITLINRNSKVDVILTAFTSSVTLDRFLVSTI